jgi:acetyl-CoA carboxylase biotin carboxylase subunit
VTGVDLVKAQIQVAAGEPLPFSQSDLTQNGAAIECRIYAEDPAAGFVPAPGRIDAMHFPDGPGVRVDAGVYAGAEVPIYYDPMIAKLATWGRNRHEAIARMRRALDEFTISGELTTNLDFHRWLMNHTLFIAGDFDTNFIAHEYHPEAAPPAGDARRLAAVLAAAVVAQRDNHHANSATPRPSGNSAAASPWKTLGRLGMLRD